MISNILVAVMCVIAVSAGIFGLWIEKGGLSEDEEKDGPEAEKDGSDAR